MVRDEVAAAVAEAFREVPDETEAIRRIAAMPAGDEAETIGYCRFLVGEKAAAEEALAVIERRPGRGYDWEVQQSERVGKILELLRKGEDGLILETLDSWAAETAAALGVERILATHP